MLRFLQIQKKNSNYYIWKPFFSDFRSLITIAHGWIIVLVAAITDTFSCFSSRCQSTWLPFLSYASFTYLIIAKTWLNLLYWSPWSLWPSLLCYSFLSLVSRDSIWFWSVEAEPLMNKSLENSVEAITHFLRVFVTIVAIPFVDPNIPGMYLLTCVLILTKYLLMRWTGKGITVDSKCY